jgi:hypothetical protein
MPKQRECILRFKFSVVFLDFFIKTGLQLVRDNKILLLRNLYSVQESNIWITFHEISLSQRYCYFFYRVK